MRQRIKKENKREKIELIASEMEMHQITCMQISCIRGRYEV